MGKKYKNSYLNVFGREETIEQEVFWTFTAEYLIINCNS